MFACMLKVVISMGTEEGFGEVVQYSFNTVKKSLAVLHSLFLCFVSLRLPRKG